jgi:hypothetical protein
VTEEGKPESPLMRDVSESSFKLAKKRGMLVFYSALLIEAGTLFWIYLVRGAFTYGPYNPGIDISILVLIILVYLSFYVQKIKQGDLGGILLFCTGIGVLIWIVIIGTRPGFDWFIMSGLP